jgi:hypothetical protein
MIVSAFLSQKSRILASHKQLDLLGLSLFMQRRGVIGELGNLTKKELLLVLFVVGR